MAIKNPGALKNATPTKGPCSISSFLLGQSSHPLTKPASTWQPMAAVFCMEASPALRRHAHSSSSPFFKDHRPCPSVYVFPIKDSRVRLADFRNFARSRERRRPGRCSEAWLPRLQPADFICTRYARSSASKLCDGAECGGRSRFAESAAGGRVV